MPRRRKRPFIPVTLTLPAEPPTQAEIDAVLMATDAIISQAGRNGVVLILNGSRSQKVKRWEWDKLPEQVWPRLETINPDIKYLLLETLRERPQPELAPVLRAWFRREVRKVRKAINHTLQTWGQRPLSHPKNR